MPSRLNIRNLEVLVFRTENYSTQRKTSEQGKEPMTNSTHYGIDARIRTQATLVGVSTLKTSPKSNLPVHTYPTCIQIHSSIQDSSGNIGNRVHIVKHAKFASCSALREPGNKVAILNTVFTVKNSRSGLDLFTSPDKKISGSI